MDVIKQSITGLIAFLTVVSAAKFLLPENKLKKITQSVLTVFVIAVMINSVKTLPFKNIDIDKKIFSSSSDTSDNYGYLIQQSVENILNKNTLEYKEVIVDSKLKDGILEVNKITIYVDKENKNNIEDYYRTVCEGLDFEENMVEINEK